MEILSDSSVGSNSGPEDTNKGAGAPEETNSNKSHTSSHKESKQVEESKEIAIMKFCGQHSDKEVEFFCENCQKFYCDVCIKTHQSEGHGTTGLKNLGNALKIVLKQQVVKMENEQKELGEQRNNYKQKENKFVVLIDDLSNLVKNLREVVMGKGKKTEVDVFNLQKEIEIKEAQIEVMKEEFKNHIQQIQQNLENKDYYRIYEKKGLVKKKEGDVDTSIKKEANMYEQAINGFNTAVQDQLTQIQAKMSDFLDEFNVGNNLLIKSSNETPPTVCNFSHYFETKYLENEDMITLCIYDFEDDELKSYKFEEDFLHMCFDSVQINERIFVSGGVISMADKNGKSGEVLKDTWEVNFKDSESLAKLDKKADMLEGKAAHTLVGLNSKCLFSIGGAMVNMDDRTMKALKTCEKYDITNNTWELAPALVQKRAVSSVCEFGQTKLFAFGGIDKNEGDTFDLVMENDYGEKFHFISSIEVLDLQQTNEWKKIMLEENEGWGKRGCAASIQVSDKLILIFGGADNVHEGLCDSFLFDVNKNKITEIDYTFSRDAPFFNRKAMKTSSNLVYAISYLNGCLYGFSVGKKKWKIADKLIANTGEYSF